MSLLSELAAYNNNTILGNDAGWRLFVLDHIENVRSNGTTLTITPALMSQCQNDLPRLLRSENISSVLDWVVYMLNDFQSDLDFVIPEIGRRTIYVPDLSYMQDLYQSYQRSLLVTAGSRATS